MTACKYWDCGWCYAPNYLKTNSINSTCVDPNKCPISPLSEPVQYETPMTEIEKLKAEIKMLEKKLSFLEELEKTKSPVEEAFKDYWGEYPETENRACGGPRWEGFQAGYNYAQKDYKVGEWEPTPQTPEQVADGLKEAFREAVKQGVVSSVEKSKTLYDVIAQWYLDSVTDNIDLDVPTCVEDLVNRIEEWLPKEQSAAGSQNVYVECTVEGFNDCLTKIKGKLR